MDVNMLSDEQLLNAYNKNMEAGKSHIAPSPKTEKFMEEQNKFNQKMETNFSVMIEKINNFMARMEEKFDENKADHEAIRKMIAEISKDHEKRLVKLENWKLVFVAKFSVYSAIALFAGSMLSTLLINWLSNKM